MGPFPIVLAWIIVDVILFAAAVGIVWYIVKREPHPASRLIELAAMTFLYAGVYENLATWFGWYAYGPSLLMYGNVPVAVLLYEAIVFYAGLRLMEKLRIPAWLRPLGAGCLAVIQDFAVDLVATSTYADVPGLGTTAHWTFHVPTAGVEIYGEPVMNFTSWMFLVGVFAAFTTIGRAWHRRSGYRTWVGIVYPLLAVIASLACLVSPLSKLTLFATLGDPTKLAWPDPNPGQWVLLGLAIVVPLALLAFFWRGRGLRESLSWQRDWPLWTVLAGVPLVHVVVAIASGIWAPLWLIVLAAIVMLALVGMPYRVARRVVAPADEAEPDAALGTA